MAVTGHGFLWLSLFLLAISGARRGVIIECRAISLTRDVPFGLGWAIEPIIQKLPKESLINTLESTRQAPARQNEIATVGQVF